MDALWIHPKMNPNGIIGIIFGCRLDSFLDAVWMHFIPLLWMRFGCS